MISLLLVVLLTALVILGITLQKTYKHIPVKELKRQARSGDPLADALYKVVGLGLSLDIFLWFVVGVSSALLFVILTDTLPDWLAVLGIAGLLWFGFAWLPTTKDSSLSRKLASYCAKPLHWIIDVLYPLLGRLEQLITRHRPVTIHTGLYTKQDLISLLGQQKGQLDNRIPKEELVIAKNALTFGDKLVRDVMTPRRAINSVNITETVGPILMGELHKSGHSRFPVYEGKKDNFVGLLYMRDMLKARAGGHVKNLMESKVYYVHDESALGEVLQAFIKTHHHMFLVVNNFEEVVGLVTMEDILERILGVPILDEFDQYDSPRAVAAKYAAKEHPERNEAVKTSPKPTGVVE